MAGTKPQPEPIHIADQGIEKKALNPLYRAASRDTTLQGTAAAAAPAGATDEAREKAIAAEAEAIAKSDPTPERAGDILGLSDASPAVDIPQASRDHGGNPAGIEVRSPTTGTSELRQTGGATGVQLGAGELASDNDLSTPTPAASRKALDD
jgi:hypothetical protein